MFGDLDQPFGQIEHLSCLDPRLHRRGQSGLAAPADIRLMRLDPIGDHGLSERFALVAFLPAARLSRAPAMATLAGNFTVLGSIANLIVVQKAAAKGVSISFWEYLRVGAPLTLITLALGTLWLSL